MALLIIAKAEYFTSNVSAVRVSTLGTTVFQSSLLARPQIKADAMGYLPALRHINLRYGITKSTAMPLFFG